MGWHYTKCSGRFGLPIVGLLIAAGWLNEQANGLAHQLAIAMEWLAGGIALGGIGTAAIVSYMYYSHRNPIWQSKWESPEPMVHIAKAAPEWYKRANVGSTYYPEYVEVD